MKNWVGARTWMLVLTTANLAAAGDDCGADNSLADSFKKYGIVPQEFPENRRLPSMLTGFGNPLCYPFGIANFRPSCRSHDACYDDAAAHKSSCDLDFYSSLKRECRDTFKASGWAWLTAGVEPLCRAQCLGAATAMYEAVRTMGGGAYSQAQGEAEFREDGRHMENARMFVPLL